MISYLSAIPDIERPYSRLYIFPATNDRKIAFYSLPRRGSTSILYMLLESVDPSVTGLLNKLELHLRNKELFYGVIQNMAKSYLTKDPVKDTFESNFSFYINRPHQEVLASAIMSKIISPLRDRYAAESYILSYFRGALDNEFSREKVGCLQVKELVRLASLINDEHFQPAMVPKDFISIPYSNIQFVSERISEITGLNLSLPALNSTTAADSCLETTPCDSHDLLVSEILQQAPSAAYKVIKEIVLTLV